MFFFVFKQQGMPMRQPMAGVPMAGQPMMQPGMMPMNMTAAPGMVQQQPLIMPQQPQVAATDQSKNIQLDPFGAF